MSALVSNRPFPLGCSPGAGAVARVASVTTALRTASLVHSTRADDQGVDVEELATATA